MKKIFILISALVMCSFFAVGCGKTELKEYILEKAFTIGDEIIDVKEASYYIMEREYYYNEIAKKESPGAPEKYWNDYLFAAGTLFKTWVKNQCFDICVCDNVYYQEAIKNGFELELADQVEAYNDAEELYENMTDKQRTQTGLSLDDIYAIMLKVKYRSCYVKNLMETVDLSAYGENPQNAFEINGEYYNELIKNYNIIVNEDVWDKIELGNLTIN